MLGTLGSPELAHVELKLLSLEDAAVREAHQQDGNAAHERTNQGRGETRTTTTPARNNARLPNSHIEVSGSVSLFGVCDQATMATGVISS